MKQPERIEVDLQAQATYIYYSHEMVAGTIDIIQDGAVAADIDAAGGVVGIEVLGFDETVVERARAFAASRGLAFPPDLKVFVA